MSNNSLASLFTDARDHAVAEIEPFLATHSGSSQFIVREAITDAFQPVLGEVLKRLRRRSVDDIEYWI